MAPEDKLPPFSAIDLPIRQVFGDGYLSGFFCNLRRRVIVSSSPPHKDGSSRTTSHGTAASLSSAHQHAYEGDPRRRNPAVEDHTAYDVLESSPSSWASRFGDLQLDFLNCIKIDGLSGPLAVEDPFGVIEESLHGELSLTNIARVDGLSAKLCCNFNSAHGLSTLAFDSSYARRWYHLHQRLEHRSPSSDIHYFADCNVKFMPNIYTGAQLNLNTGSGRLDDIWYKTAVHSNSSLLTLAFKQPKHFEAAVYHRPTYKLEMGVVYGYRLGESECDLAVGIKVGDESVDGSCIRAKLNNKSQLGVSFSSIVGAGRVVVSALLNTRQIDNFTAHQFGIGFEV